MRQAIRPRWCRLQSVVQSESSWSAWTARGAATAHRNRIATMRKATQFRRWSLAGGDRFQVDMRKSAAPLCRLNYEKCMAPRAGVVKLPSDDALEPSCVPGWWGFSSADLFGDKSQRRRIDA